MLLTITSTQVPATDLGYLLHKNPTRVQSFELSFGMAHVFYPEVSEERCTAALLLDIDPIGLVRKRRGPSGDAGALDQYVNDRPYVASSFLSVAIARVFGSALAGRSKHRPELADRQQPLEARISVLACRGGEQFLRTLFEPLGYDVTVDRHGLDKRFPEWGDSPYYDVRLAGLVRLRDLLSHLYVLIPVLDDEKHYWVGDEELEKLLHHGEGWLAAHPQKEAIATRYLKHRRHLARQALARLMEDESDDPDALQEAYASQEEAIEKPMSLNEQRISSVVAALKSVGARSVVDLGCGEGRLLGALLRDKDFVAITGMDVSHAALSRAAGRLHLDRLPSALKDRLTLMQGSLTYRDKRIAGFDAATAVEVIEHLDAPRLAAFERVLFEFARPKAIVMTTPNAEYNVLFDGLPAGKLRHGDHRFEWTRAEFQAWALRVAERFGYTARFLPIGTEASGVGAPTQMAIFTLGSDSR
jgi:3' terminal RNA ribose 2'-O-methyltransferase Hen1